jgi:hypothetical protein
MRNQGAKRSRIQIQSNQGKPPPPRAQSSVLRSEHLWLIQNAILVAISHISAQPVYSEGVGRVAPDQVAKASIDWRTVILLVHVNLNDHELFVIAVEGLVSIQQYAAEWRS